MSILLSPSKCQLHFFDFFSSHGSMEVNISGYKRTITHYSHNTNVFLNVFFYLWMCSSVLLKAFSFSFNPADFIVDQLQYSYWGTGNAFELYKRFSLNLRMCSSHGHKPIRACTGPKAHWTGCYNITGKDTGNHIYSHLLTNPPDDELFYYVFVKKHYCLNVTSLPVITVFCKLISWINGDSGVFLYRMWWNTWPYCSVWGPGDPGPS